MHILFTFFCVFMLTSTSGIMLTNSGGSDTHTLCFLNVMLFSVFHFKHDSESIYRLLFSWKLSDFNEKYILNFIICLLAINLAFVYVFILILCYAAYVFIPVQVSHYVIYIYFLSYFLFWKQTLLFYGIS